MRQIDEFPSQSVFETQGLKSMTIRLPGSSFHNRQSLKVKFFNVAMMVDHRIEMCGSLISNDFFFLYWNWGLGYEVVKGIVQI